LSAGHTIAGGLTPRLIGKARALVSF